MQRRASSTSSGWRCTGWTSSTGWSTRWSTAPRRATTGWPCSTGTATRATWTSWFATDSIHLGGLGAVQLAIFIHRGLKQLGLTRPRPAQIA